MRAGTFAYLIPTDRIELAQPAETDPVTSWIQVAKVLPKTPHSEHGELEITREDLMHMLANFKEFYPQPPYELPIDYDHLATKKDRKPGDGIAAGWFKDMQLRADGTELWARVEWTPPAAQKIRNKEYRYISPTFFRQWVTNAGRQLGVTMVAAALTNFPFLNMQAISLSGDTGWHVLIDRTTRSSTYMGKVLKVKDASGNDVEIPIEAITLDSLSAVPVVAELIKKAPKDDQQVVSSEVLTQLNQKVIELSNGIDALKTESQEAKTRAAAAEKQIRDTRLASLKRSGRIDGADETYGKSLIELANASTDGAKLFDAWVTAMEARQPKIALSREHGSGGEGDHDVETQSQKFLTLVEQHERENKTDRRAAIKAIELAHPDLAKAYREDAPDYQTARPIKNVVPLAR